MSERNTQRLDFVASFPAGKKYNEGRAMQFHIQMDAHSWDWIEWIILKKWEVTAILRIMDQFIVWENRAVQ